jgi:hypothetical protein
MSLEEVVSAVKEESRSSSTIQENAGSEEKSQTFQNTLHKEDVTTTEQPGEKSRNIQDHAVEQVPTRKLTPDQGSALPATQVEEPQEVQNYTSKQMSTIPARVQYEIPIQTDTIPATQIKDRLRNLRNYVPHQEEGVYDFTTLMANYLTTGEVTPTNLIVATERTILDSRMGRSSITGEPMQSLISRETEAALKSRLEDLAYTLCPTIASEARTLYAIMNPKRVYY